MDFARVAVVFSVFHENIFLEMGNANGIVQYNAQYTGQYVHYFLNNTLIYYFFTKYITSS